MGKSTNTDRQNSFRTLKNTVKVKNIINTSYMSVGKQDSGTLKSFYVQKELGDIYFFK